MTACKTLNDVEHALDAVAEAAKYSSIPGFSRLGHFDSQRAKFIWLIVLFTSFVGFIFHLGINSMRFFQFSMISQTVLNQEPFVFPDVTICPQFPINSKRMARERQFQGVQISGETLYNRIKDVWKASLNNSQDTVGQYSRFDNIFARKSLDRYVDEFFLAQDFEEFVLECYYNGIECQANNFSLFRYPFYQNCWTFSPANAQVRRTGIDNGLSLIFNTAFRRAYLTDEEILSWLRGASIYIQERGTVPTTNQVGIIVSSGTHSIIEIEMTKTQKHPGIFSWVDDILHPNKSAEERRGDKTGMKGETLIWTDWRGRVKRNMTIAKYSTNICEDLKFQTIFAQTCGCLSEINFLSERLLKELRSRNVIKSTDLYCHSVLPNLVIQYTLTRTLNNTILVRHLQPQNNSNNNNNNNNNITNTSIVNNDQINITIPFTNWQSAKIESLMAKKQCFDRVLNQINTNVSINRSGSNACARKDVEYEYRGQLRSYQWPESVKNAQAALLTLMEKKIHKSKNPDILKLAMMTKLYHLEDIRQNFLKVQLFAKSMEGSLIVEHMAYPFSAFLSDVGGVLSLWAGMSVITFIEVFSGIFLVLRPSWSPDHQVKNSNTAANHQEAEMCHHADNITKDPNNIRNNSHNNINNNNNRNSSRGNVNYNNNNCIIKKANESDLTDEDFDSIN